MKNLAFVFMASILLTGCAHKIKEADSIKILSISNVNWEKLNPARGDKSPQAGTIWGDRKGKEATGFLAKFVDGFSSPPHIHNVSYRAIVIEGLVHNDDPKAEKMWMPSGSYWTQPAGETHITSAKGKTNIALVEIDNGPYLVKPINKKFDNGQKPFNIHASNIIWRDQGGYEIRELWANSLGRVTGSLLKFRGNIEIKARKSKIVLISGKIIVKESELDAGSLISVDGISNVKSSCQSEECILYLKTDDVFEVF